MSHLMVQNQDEPSVKCNAREVRRTRPGVWTKVREVRMISFLGKKNQLNEKE